MILRKIFASGVLTGLLLISGLSAAMAQAQCTPDKNGTPGDDYIVCDEDDRIALVVNGYGGNDTLINNNIVYAIEAGEGNDTIINNGEIDFVINGDNGDDLIILQNSPDPSLNVFGGNDTDTLRFEYTMTNQSDHTAASAAIAALAAGNGTITINGQTVNYFTMELFVDALVDGYTIVVTVPADTELHVIPQYIVRDGRVNPEEAGWSSAVAYCAGGGLQVYAADGNLQAEAGAGAVQSALETAVNSGENQTIAFANGYGLYALFSGELQINGPDGYSFVFAAGACG